MYEKQPFVIPIYRVTFKITSARKKRKDFNVQYISKFSKYIDNSAINISSLMSGIKCSVCYITTKASKQPTVGTSTV